MKRSAIDQVILGLVLSLCVLTTGAGYLAAKAREDSLRREYLNAAAQGILESIFTQLLRTSESLRTAAALLGDDPPPGPQRLALFTYTIPHLAGTDHPVQWLGPDALTTAVAQSQQIRGSVQVRTDLAGDSAFELLTPVGARTTDPRDPGRGVLRGVLSTRISVASLLSEAAYRSEAQQFEMEIFDRNEQPPASIFRATPFNHVTDNRLDIHASVDVFGHSWEVVLRPMAAASPWWTTPHLVVIGGTAVTLLLMALLVRLRLSRIRMELAQDKEREERSKREQEEWSRQLSDRVAQLDRSRGVGEMAFVIGHELSQPLTAISSLAELGGAMTEDPETQAKKLRDIFQKISRNAARGSALLDQIRNYVRGSTARSLRLDIRRTLTDVKDLLDAEAQRLHVELHLALDGQRGDVDGDPLQLSQVLVNVIRNAIEASAQAESPQVFVRMNHDGLLVHVSVRDHGPGFSEEALRQAGTPFYTTKRAGLGLGLTISSNIIKGHGGTLQLGNAPDGGAQVVIKLPAAH